MPFKKPALYWGQLGSPTMSKTSFRKSPSVLKSPTVRPNNRANASFCGREAFLSHSANSPASGRDRKNVWMVAGFLKSVALSPTKSINLRRDSVSKRSESMLIPKTSRSNRFAASSKADNKKTASSKLPTSSGRFRFPVSLYKRPTVGSNAIRTRVVVIG